MGNEINLQADQDVDSININMNAESAECSAPSNEEKSVSARNNIQEQKQEQAHNQEEEEEVELNNANDNNANENIQEQKEAQIQTQAHDQEEKVVETSSEESYDEEEYETSSEENQDQNELKENNETEHMTKAEGVRESFDDNDSNNDTDDGFGSNENENSETWGDFDSCNYDGQDYIEIKKGEFTPPLINDEGPLVPGPCSTDDGNSSKLKPVTSRAHSRAWICEHCHAINNLIDSMKRHYKCNCCAGKYRPGQCLIESKEQDVPAKEKKTYKSWICKCSGINHISWDNCDVCEVKRPEEGLNTFLSSEEPVHTVPELPSVRDYCNSSNEDTGWSTQNKANYNIENKAKVWVCTKCITRNENLFLSCKLCGRHRFAKSEKKNENVPKKKRHTFYGDIDSIGTTRQASNYPIKSKLTKKRIINLFGKPYRSNYFCFTGNNKWRMDNEIICGFMKVVCNHFLDEKFVFVKPFGIKSIAINERSGYIVKLCVDYIVILAPIGWNVFNIVATFNYKSDKNRQFTDFSRNNFSRIRFVENHIFIFDTLTSDLMVYLFDDIKNIITSQKKIISDAYIAKVGATDFMVTSNKLLIILFDRWLGIFKLHYDIDNLQLERVEWYHAIAFSTEDLHVDIASSTPSFEMCGYDDCDIKEDKKENDDIDYKSSIKNYIYINAEHNLIAIHPSNPTFEFLHIAENIKNGSSFCNSKKYGTFWINNDCDTIHQSSKCQVMDCDDVLCSLQNEFVWKQFKRMPLNGDDKVFTNKNITKFESVLYDEGYGISGRLLVECTVVDNAMELSIFYQFFNQNELNYLKQELQKTEYYLMPGSSKKTFNFIVYVFEMLYGTDLIDILLESSDFNPLDKSYVSVKAIGDEKAENDEDLIQIQKDVEH